MSAKPHILLVEADYMLADVYIKALSSKFDVSLARDAQSAIDVLDSTTVNAIITDTLLGENNGIEVLYELRSYTDWLSIPVIIQSSLPQSEFPMKQSDWATYGIAGFAYKPHTKPEQLADMVQTALL